METEHTYSEHQNRLNALCRLCGGKTKREKDARRRPEVLCSEFSSLLSQNKIVDILSDIYGKHSKQMCHKCYNHMTKMRLHGVSDTVLEGLATRAVATSSIWADFDSSISVGACSSCYYFTQSSKGGRPKKPKRGNPNLMKRKLDSEGQVDMSSSSVFSPSSYSTPVKRVKTSDSITSPVVSVMTSDTQTSPFLIPRVETSTDTGPSTSKVDSSTSPFTRAQALGLKVRSVGDITGPLSKDEEKLATHLNRVKMNESGDGTVRCKTGGQNLVFIRVVQARKGSAVASSRTVKSRARLTDRFCKITSGKSMKDFIRQKSEELRRTDKHKKTLILASACRIPVKLSKTQLLALRIKLGLSGAKHKLMRTFLRSAGVALPTSSEEKREQQAAVSGEVLVEKKTLFYRDENDGNALKDAEIPVASVDNIPTFVFNLLEKNAQTDRLTWHEGAIPEEEVWVKIGADHGGGIFKVTMQIANVTNPNSKHNTSILIMAPCKDTHENIKRLLLPYKNQFQKLNDMQWRDKRVRVFVFGDYDFLLKVYGLSGPAGKHPCLYCTATKQQLQHPPAVNAENIATRSLNHIQSDHRRYKRSKRKNKKAKEFNNAIRAPILRVDVDHVSPPYLHILLGTTKKHHDLLVAESDALDQKIGEKLAENEHQESGEKFTSDFKKYINEWREIKVLEARKRELETTFLFRDPSNNTPLATFKAKQAHIKDKIDDLDEEIEHMTKSIKLPPRSGPVNENIDITLKQNKIPVQAWHSRSFIGNHCHKYMKGAFKRVCQSVVEKTGTLTTDPVLLASAQAIADKFAMLNAMYAEVHTCISHCRPVTDSEIRQAQSKINAYMGFFRLTFPSVAVIPKQHILEYHCTAFMFRWGFGLGLHGEQGGEETHAVINALKPRVWGLRSESDKLRVLMREHMLLTSPVTRLALHSRTKKKRKQ